MSETLLTKHASSLQHLYLDITDGMEMHIIASTLINNHIHLRLLDVSIFFNPSPLIASLISYLSSAGDLLESLKVKWYGSGTYNTDALLVSVATSCSKLTRMLFYGVVTCSMEKVRLLYEQCLHLQDAVIDEAIDTNSTSRSVSIWVKGSNDDWAVCLSHALRRRQCKKVTLRLRGNYYHPVENLKSMLEPYQICVNTCFVPEAPLISLLQDLPHLYRLDTMPFDENCNCDAILAAILEHVESLRELDVTYYVYNNVNKVDKLLNELITRCQLLDVLKLLNCGMPSIVAVSKHSSLRNVSLHMTELVSEEILDGLLLDEKEDNCRSSHHHSPPLHQKGLGIPRHSGIAGQRGHLQSRKVLQSFILNLFAGDVKPVVDVLIASLLPVVIGQYKKVTLIQGEDYYHLVGKLKSLLELYEIRVETSEPPEAILISLQMQNLPRLNICA
eukprot:scaffold311_cov171-Ochromonas_danica.AAC.1